MKPEAREAQLSQLRWRLNIAETAWICYRYGGRGCLSLSGSVRDKQWSRSSCWAEIADKETAGLEVKAEYKGAADWLE